MSTKSEKITGCVVVPLLFGVLAACATEPTKRVEEVQPAGFLQDYSILSPGGEGEASLVYWNRTANWAAYDKVQVDPVTIWLDKGSAADDVSKEDLQRLADLFHAKLVEKLSEDYALTSTAGPGVLRVRIALTDAEASNPFTDTISTYVPQAYVVSSVLTLPADTAAFVGEASFEAQLRDAASGELLGAAVGRRAGTKYVFAGTTNSWGDVERAIDVWTTQLRDNLRARKAGA
jgi:hypothetical protein